MGINLNNKVQAYTIIIYMATCEMSVSTSPFVKVNGIYREEPSVFLLGLKWLQILCNQVAS